MRFETESLENLNIQLIDGDRGKNYPSQADFFSCGYCLFLSAKNVTHSGFEFSEKIYIDKQRDELLRAGKLQRGDIILTTRGTIGNLAFYSEDISDENIRINSGMLIIRADKDLWNRRFLFYLLSSSFIKSQITSLTSGSAVPQLPARDIKKFQLPKIPKPTQNAIDKIIGDISEKIRFNTQTNQTLESIAQAIFKSWFVDFEPVKAKMAAKERWYAMQPTSESASPVCYADEAALPDLETYTNLAAMCAISGKSETELAQLQQQNPDQYQQLAETAALFPSAMVDSELGEIPEGYWVARFSDIIFKYIDNRGKTPPTQEAGIPLLEVRHLPASSIKPDLNTDKHVDEETYENWFRAHLESDDLIMSTVGTIGRLCMVPPNTKIAIAQNLLGLRFNRDKASPYFMYYQMNDFRFRNDVDARLVITVQASIKRKDLETIPLLSAPIELQKKFESFIKPFVLSQHSDENLKLAEIRDSLLPKLLSGEIDLTKVENEVT